MPRTYQVSARTPENRRQLNHWSVRAARVAARAASTYYTARTPTTNMYDSEMAYAGTGGRSLVSGPTASSHVGRFGRTRPANRGTGHRLLRRGLGYERITAGVVSSTVDNVVYIGHSTWPAVTVLKAACMALARTAYQKLGIDLNRGNSVIPEHALATIAGFSFGGTLADFREEQNIGGFVPGTTTIEQMATEMARTVLRLMYTYFDGAGVPGAVSRAPVKWNTFYLANGTTPSAGVVIPLGDTLLDMAMMSKLKLQNISFNSTVAADPDVDTSVNINNITLEGYHYKGWGNHMLMKGDTAVSYRAAANEPPITTERDVGVMRKNPASTVNTGPAMDTTPVKPYQWQNCSRGAAVYLDAGEAKTDYISQEKRMTWQSLCDKLLAAGTNTNNNLTSENGVLAENWSNQGKYSAFGLSRLINYDNAGASSTSLQLLYEVEQRIYAAVVRVFKTPAVASIQLASNINIVQS